MSNIRILGRALLIAMVANMAWYQGANPTFVAWGALTLGVVFLVPPLVQALPRRAVEWPDAQPAVATVQKVSTGRRRRDGTVDARVDVIVENHRGECHPGVFTRRVPADSVEGIHRGLMFPAMYRPEKKEKVKIARGRMCKPAQEIFDAARLRQGLTDRAALEADTRGVETTAMLVGCNRTSESGGGVPVYELDIQVRRQDGTAFRTTRSLALGEWQAALLRPGRHLRVRYLPEREQDLVVAVEPERKELA